MEEAALGSSDETEGRGPSVLEMVVKASRRRCPGPPPLYSGQGELEAAIALKRLAWTESWDVRNGPGLDLTNTARVAMLLQSLKSARYYAVHPAPPCRTFAQAS